MVKKIQGYQVSKSVQVELYVEVKNDSSALTRLTGDSEAFKLMSIELQDAKLRCQNKRF